MSVDDFDKNMVAVGPFPRVASGEGVGGRARAPSIRIARPGAIRSMSWFCLIACIHCPALCCKVFKQTDDGRVWKFEHAKAKQLGSDRYGSGGGAAEQAALQFYCMPQSVPML